jgi:molecular chaperone DnaJ
MARDYYAVLGVPRDAGTEDIKRAFRRLARETHPDANPGDPAADARFREIAEAYEVLSDPNRRRAYDRGDTIDLSDLFAGGFSGFDDLLRSVFGEASGFGGFSDAGRPHRGRDILVAVEVDLATAAFGGDTEVVFRTQINCDICGGDGAAPGSHPETCTTCGGTGTMRMARRGILGTMMSVVSCTTCKGQGTVITDPCASCRGTGTVPGERKVRVEIPAGITSGSRLRLSGRGEYPGRNGIPGDLHVEIRVSPHDHFTRDGDDLVYDLRLGMAEAALGTDTQVPLLEGDRHELRIPAGTQPGTVFRLPGMGTARLGRRGRGDLLVRVIVEVPTDLSAEEEEALRQFAGLRGEKTAARRRRKRS